MYMRTLSHGEELLLAEDKVLEAGARAECFWGGEGEGGGHWVADLEIERTGTLLRCRLPEATSWDPLSFPLPGPAHGPGLRTNCVPKISML